MDLHRNISPVIKFDNSHYKYNATISLIDIFKQKYVNYFGKLDSF